MEITEPPVDLPLLSIAFKIPHVDYVFDEVACSSHPFWYLHLECDTFLHYFLLTKRNLIKHGTVPQLLLCLLPAQIVVNELERLIIPYPHSFLLNLHVCLFAEHLQLCYRLSPLVH